MQIGKYKYLTFCSFSIKNIFKPFAIIRSNSYKYVSQYYDVDVYFLGFHLHYADTNYNKICHIIIKHNNTYKRVDPEGAKKLRCLLTKYAKYELVPNVPPFSFNFEYVDTVDKEDKFNFYITVEKSWLKKHAKFLVPSIINEIVDINEVKDNEHKFPKYSKYVHRINDITKY
jgi:hypothetical protein